MVEDQAETIPETLDEIETDDEPFVAALAVPVLPTALRSEETLDELKEEPSSVPLRPLAFDESPEETIARGRLAADESPGGFWPTAEEIAATPRSLDADGNVTAIGPDLDADHRRRFDAFKRTSRGARRTSPILRGPAPRTVGCHSRQRRAAPTRSRGSRRGTAARSSSSGSSDGSGSSDLDDGDPERLGPPSPSCSPSNRRASA